MPTSFDDVLTQAKPLAEPVPSKNKIKKNKKKKFINPKQKLGLTEQKNLLKFLQKEKNQYKREYRFSKIKKRSLIKVLQFSLISEKRAWSNASKAIYRYIIGSQLITLTNRWYTRVIKTCIEYHKPLQILGIIKILEKRQKKTKYINSIRILS